MRIPIYCSDINSYLENPKFFLPKEIQCLRDPDHKLHWHTCWWRFVILDHVNKVPIPMFRLYCLDCKETISIWPEFILPYQPELIGTHERVLVENLEGKPVKEIAEEIGYDPRSISRWIKRALNQALFIAPRVIPKLIKYLACELLPLSSTLATEVVKELLAWLYRYAKLIEFPRLYRLMGLCNMLKNGELIIWGGAIGRCRYSREIVSQTS